MKLLASGSPYEVKLKKQGLILSFIIFLIIASISIDAFMTTTNILTVLRQSSIIGIIAIAMTFVIIGGNFDLSVGSLLSLTTVMSLDLHDKIGPLATIIVVILIGILIGCINGALVGFLKLNSLIVTLGMLSLLQGMTLIYSNGENVSIAQPEETWFSIIGRGNIIGIPIPVIILVTLVIIFQFILTKTTYGRKVYAIGGNGIASNFTGIRRNLTVFSTFILTGVCTSIAGIIMASRVMVSQNQIGQGYELEIIAAVILGGTSLMGGSGSVTKTLIGVLILGFVNNALLLLGFPYYTQWIVTWFVIIAAVWLDMSLKKERSLA